MTTPRDLWPIHPPLQEGEWLGSWLRRVAAANKVPLHGLLRDLGFSREDLISPPGVDFIESLARRSAQSSDILAASAVLPPDLLTTVGRRGETPRAFLGVHVMQICPACLAADEAPYIRRNWLDRHEVHCDRHQRLLLDACPYCGGQLRASFDLDKTWRRERQGAAAGIEPVATCIFCQGDLRRSDATAPVEAGPLLPVSERFARPAADWEPFLRAFENFVAAFGLFTLVQGEQLSLEPSSVAANRWVESNTGQLRLITSERLEIRTSSARAGTWLVSDDVSRRLKRFAGVALVESESPNGWAISRPQLIRLWLLQALLDMTPRDLRLLWPQLLEGAYAYLRQDRPVEVAFTLTDDQWDLIEESVSPAGNWNIGNGAGAWQAPDRRLVLDQVLTAIGARHGVTSGRVRQTVDGSGIWKLAIRLGDGAQLGFALGLLYRHLHASMVETRRRRAWRPGGYPDWQLATDGLFRSDGMIELTRKLNPSLHRELVGRVLLGWR